MVLVAHPSLPVQSLNDLIAMGKSEPGTIPYGSAGYGSTTYLGVRALEENSGASFLHVPFKGLGQAFHSLVGGEVKFIYSAVGTALPLIKAGHIRPLAVAQSVRQLPNVPTVVAAGYPASEVVGTFSIMAPAGTSSDIVNRLSDAIREALRNPGLAAILDEHALIPVFDTPQTFGEFLKSEREKWSKFITLHHIVVE
jgi:tripartite-type tricarboxylate transporter receptor subunit TctC